jgi:hypothetical protein
MGEALWTLVTVCASRRNENVAHVGKSQFRVIHAGEDDPVALG